MLRGSPGLIFLTETSRFASLGQEMNIYQCSISLQRAYKSAEGFLALSGSSLYWLLPRRSGESVSTSCPSVLGKLVVLGKLFAAEE